MTKPLSKSPPKARLVTAADRVDWAFETPTIWQGRAEAFLTRVPADTKFKLIVTSPPYNIGKEYERPRKLSAYLAAQRALIRKLARRLAPDGSICWQVGNHVHGAEITPLDIEFHKIFKRLGFRLRNRIIWHFGHGLHAKRRFSGRYEVVLWYTKSNKYTFHLDPVRVPSKYPGKKSYKGNRKGEYSSHPLGKNPEDVWQIPNVKANHVEKTLHPCQFPVGLIERLVLALTNKGDLVLDPFAGVASAGVAAVVHGRRFVGCETVKKYASVGKQRLTRALQEKEPYRPHNRPIYDHTQSKLSKRPLYPKCLSKLSTKRLKRAS